ADFWGPIFLLTQEGTPAYFLPGRGFINEPTDNLGEGYIDLFGRDSKAAAAYLRKLHVEYFLADMARPLWASLPYSTLFDPEYLPRFFDTVIQDGSVYLLKLRENDGIGSDTVSGDFQFLWELRRKFLIPDLVKALSMAEL